MEKEQKEKKGAEWIKIGKLALTFEKKQKVSSEFS